MLVGFNPAFSSRSNKSYTSKASQNTNFTGAQVLELGRFKAAEVARRPVNVEIFAHGVNALEHLKKDPNLSGFIETVRGIALDRGDNITVKAIDMFTPYILNA